MARAPMRMAYFPEKGKLARDPAILNWPPFEQPADAAPVHPNFPGRTTATPDAISYSSVVPRSRLTDEESYG